MDSASAAFDARWHPGRPVPVRGTAGTLFQRSHIIRGSGNKMPDAHIRASFMRRGTQGLGYDPDERAADEYAHHESTERHPIHFVREGSAAASSSRGSDYGGLRQELDGAGGSDHLMMLVANFGALDRVSQGDRLNDYLTRNNHVVLLQEAAGTIYPMLSSLRALGCSVAPHALTGVLAGGSGRKAVRNLYTEHSGLIPRPWTLPGSAHAARFHACSLTWHHLKQDIVLKRAGLEEVRAMSVHYESWAAKKPDSVRCVLASVWRLCRRDNIRLLGGDFNQAAGLVSESLKAVSSSVPGFSYYLQEGYSPEMLAITLNWPGDEPLLIKKRAERLDGLSRAAFGLRESRLCLYIMYVRVVFQLVVSQNRGAQFIQWPACLVINHPMASILS